MATITKETIIADILDIAPEKAPLFFEIGMHCLGCVMASGETVEQACEAHDVNVDEFLKKLNAS
jgi:hybrid cluster-associated redox disulfide protein